MNCMAISLLWIIHLVPDQPRLQDPCSISKKKHINYGRTPSGVQVTLLRGSIRVEFH